MTSDRDRFRLIDTLFGRALEKPPAEREAFLAAACAGDADLRREVERLLAADGQAGTFFDHPPALPALPEDTAFHLPARLGAYQLLREIGRGGMGTVYLARRDDEQYEQEVAIKVLRWGIAGAETVHRFHTERQILARLVHPGIARLYDGGRTGDGRPFLVMELVSGLPLDEHCDRNALGIDERLEIFLRVCAAVQHAHQSLLVHRDLKPSNILVTAAGEPKLLDFGIAKQLTPEGGGADLTRTGSRLMTPSYASPEQVRGEPITTTSDVYSLGVVLFELLAGCSPYRAGSGLPHEIERAICDQEPERPSQALFRDSRDGRDGASRAEAIARARGTGSAALRRRLRGDLDTIVLTALRKDPAQRYGTAAELAADIDRHLRHLPVAAQPDSLLYRARKLLRRRRSAVAAAAVLALATAAFLLGLAEQQRRIVRERDKAQAALGFLVDLFGAANPYHEHGEPPTAAEILRRGAARVSHDLEGRPDVQVAVMDAIGQAQLGLGRADEAEPVLERAVALRRKAGAGEPLELAESLEHLAAARYEQSDFTTAERLLREAIALRRRAGSPPLGLAAALNQLGMTIALRRPSPEVAALHREAMELARRAEGPNGPTVADSLLLLGRLAHDQGHYAEAERLYREGLAIERKALAPGDPRALRDRAELAAILLDAGKPKETEALLLKLMELQRQVLGPGHPDLLTALNNLGMARQAQGNTAGAEAAYREALLLPRRSTSNTDLLHAALLGNLATVLQMQGRFAESRPLLAEALALRRRALGDRHPLVAQILIKMARAERAGGNPDGALDLAHQALTIVETAEGPGHPHTAFPLLEIAADLMARGDAADIAGAEPILRRVLDLRRRALPAGHPDIAKAEAALAECRAAMRGERSPK
ncbi:MAG TPA: serine/threonine-protein kinase [Thermoanaerobaculia bacterium]